MPSDLDPPIFSDAQFQESRDASIVPGFVHRGMKSHILLAACGAEERAYEDQGKGVFTAALLKLLYEVGTQNVTYANLLQRLPRLTE
jgi:hypothetical protein